MKIIYCLEYYKQIEGYKQLVAEYFESIEHLLSSVDEYCLHKGDYGIYRFTSEKFMSSTDVLAAFEEETGAQ